MATNIDTASRAALTLAEANSATWVAMLRRHAHLRPAHAALRGPAGTVTYAELDQRADRAASALAEAGVGPGDRVGLLQANRTEFVEALAGIHRLGAIAVPMNFRLVGAEVAYILGDSGARVVIVDAERAAVAADAAVAIGAGPIRILVVGDDEAGAPGERWATALEGAAGRTPPLTADTVAAWAPTAPAVLTYTSGTTGRPKGAILTYLNLLMVTISNLQTGLNDGEDTVTLVSAPLFHIAGLCLVLPTLFLGQTVVLGGGATFDPAATLDLIESEGVTSLFLVPTQWQAVCSQPDLDRRQLRLRMMSWGASPALPSTLRAMTAAFPGVPNTALFGQTEMTGSTTALGGDDAERKFGSVGQPLSFVDARVVDEDMHDVAPGAVGEIVYRGPTMMAGYWNNPPATADALRGGWFHSGDLVRRDDEEFIYVVDRTKDMIISGGENIYSSEVEQAIDGHPKVREVAVVGVRHPRWVETPLAVVAAADPDDPPTAAEINAWLRGRLAPYKRPGALRVVDALPRNASGKVLKNALRERFADALDAP
jgi:fatty-acyl-CoA synthase